MSQFVYFQKYHGKENVHSSNVLYMLQKVYYYNPRKFYKFLEELLESEEPDNWILQFKTQEKHAKGVADFSIIQKSFKIVVEAKEKYNPFDISQIERHLEALKNDFSWNRKTATLDGFKRIMDALAGIDLTEEPNSYEKGRLLVQNLLAGLQSRSDGNRFMGEFASKSEVGILSRGILQVKDGETFLDFAAGTGTTTILSVEAQECNIINADINRESLSIATMLYIMNGYKHIKMTCEDVLSNPDIEWEADKIFVDAPIGMRMVNLRYGAGLIDCGVLSVYKALECLREDGVAVVALPSSVLFGTAKTHIALKRELVDKGYLQAVIALPITWFGAGVTINLLILSKQQTNNKVLFINAHSAVFAKYVQKANGKLTSITQEGLDEILDIFHNNTEIEGLSSNISIQTIEEKDYDLMPTTYIKERLEEGDMTVEEIDAELEKLYASLGVK